MEAELSRDRWGLRFVDGEAEQAYRRWQVERAITFTRVGMVGSLFNWAIALIVTWTISASTAWLATAIILLGPVPLIIAALLATYPLRLRPSLRWPTPQRAWRRLRSSTD